ncbi:hypothetical protein ACFWQ6_08475 [Streptomyces coelicoflavus]|uniref:hypothetical protein n=1 Tax=Streptomyces coelicoflavus TaxID=285562 RepID=UPI003664EBFC
MAAGYAHLLMDNRGQGNQYGCGGDNPDPHADAPGVDPARVAAVGNSQGGCLYVFRQARRGVLGS